MSVNDYHFVTRWRIRGNLTEVADVLQDAQSLPEWWPAVYLEVTQLAAGDNRGIGEVIGLHTKGWLPYTLKWRFTVTESNYPLGFALRAEGDLEGSGIWSLEQDGPWANVTYDWKIRADKPVLRMLSFLLKPIFSANHAWAMARGQESLALEIARRRAGTPEEARAIPDPPGPTFPHSIGYRRRTRRHHVLDSHADRGADTGTGLAS
jgi:hypothetical protein